MNIVPLSTRTLTPPQDDLFAVLKKSLPKKIPEKSIVTVTSKIVSIGEGRCIPDHAVQDKDALIMHEAEYYLARDFVPGKWVLHTLKHNLFMPSAGIDESNALGHYILWPEDPKKSARSIWHWLRKTYRLKEVGVIITDSHSIPLRRGSVGISLSHFGFRPVNDYRNKKDLFGRMLKITQANIVDALASAAVVTQGEGNEHTPLALITQVPFVSFRQKAWQPQKPYSRLEVPIQEDLYAPFLKALPWRRKRKRLQAGSRGSTVAT